MDDPITLAIAFAAGCKTTQYTYPEFKLMCNTIKVDNMQALQGKIFTIRNDIKNDSKLHAKIYSFTYRYYLEPGMKNIPTETATALWPLLFTGNGFEQKCSFLDDWINWLDGLGDKRAAIKKDEWDMFLEFNNVTRGDLKNFEDDGTYPSIFDDFLEWIENGKK